eukprot:TRINITY_DN19955_c0_g1_i1.p1 TRINITY_DN19955_c0_g1~~TRINITY_DN19955_c0_g1_i1.p1  ORF type:complete len:187 (+),score=47.80 TRINITY_DN19955_c0_g1_i1:51-611(+)
MAAKHVRMGEAALSKVDKINSEVLTFTYGAIVTQLIKDYEDIEEVNKQLENMGYNIGLRLIDELIAKSGIGRCADFRETAEVISKIGFKMFLGISPAIVNWNGEYSEFSLLIDENPLTEFVELPEQYRGLHFSNLICGVIRGAMETLQMKIECKFVKDQLRGDDTTELRVILKEIMADEVPVGYGE